MTSLLGNNVNLLRKSTICYLINLSNNLQITDVKLTGLYFSDLFLDSLLNNGMMFTFSIEEEPLPLLITS